MYMSREEVNKLEIMQQIRLKKLKQREAAAILGISERQVRRVWKRYSSNGAKGIVNKRRGMESNRKISTKLRGKVIKLARDKYIGFGPTLLSEKLEESYGIKYSKETLRRWLKEEGLWEEKRRRKARIHQRRERRACLGELVQIDGSPHDWFEGRAERCCLLVFIDDATSNLMHLQFEESETTAGYLKATRAYINEHGIPVAYYGDKSGIFRVNVEESKGAGQTQFERTLKFVGIEMICANSPQAKGRVERANGILQDRLVKEMRLRGINNIEEANKFLPEFIETYNAKFAVEPRNKVNAHRKNTFKASEIDVAFSFHYKRKLSKNLELSYKNIIYQMITVGHGYTMKHALVTVCEDLAGKVKIIYKGKSQQYKCYSKQQHRTAPIVDAKEITQKVNKILKLNKPSKDHPWRTYDKYLLTKKVAMVKLATASCG
jgi:transposase